MLEGIQRRTTKMIQSLRNLSYDEKLKRLGMFSLRRRKLKGDMIEVLKKDDLRYWQGKSREGFLYTVDKDRRTRKQILDWIFSLEALLIIGTISQMW